MNSDELFLERLNEKLYYMLVKCPPEEYDSDQVNALIDLKRVLAPESEIIPTHITYHNPIKMEQKIIHIPYTSRSKTHIIGVGIAIAACIISIILIGHNAPIRALPDTGFFLWLEKNTEGMLAVTSPSNTKQKCEDCQCCPKCDCGCADASNKN